jgi:uncharacterized membrane protein YkvA (DUF1232 family)
MPVLTPPAPATSAVSIPGALNRYLSAGARDDLPGVALYVDRGAEIINAEAILALRRLLGPLQAKIAEVVDSVHLRNRLEVLARYFDEACHDGQTGTPAHREAAFALLYFLKGFDRIPDTVPEIGLLDDALIVEVVLSRNATAYRAHWLRRHRVWSLGI